MSDDDDDDDKEEKKDEEDDNNDDKPKVEEIGKFTWLSIFVRVDMKALHRRR